jgi:trehalose 2-sulfotransferase
MEPAQIFQAIEETRFLKKLSSQARLFFVGQSASLKYIKNFFSQHQKIDYNYYYDLSAQTIEELNEIADFGLYQAIVVVSLEDEATLFAKVNQQLDPLVHPVILQLFADIFINLLCDRPLLKTIPQQNQKAQKSYAIVTTPRSGSTYLCDLLKSTAIAGHPSEHLRLATQELSRYCNFNYLKLLDNLQEYRTTKNNVFGTKLISHFLFELRQTKPDFKVFVQSIEQFILLIRKDKVAQAVSLVLAQKTEVWHLHSEATKTSYQSQLESIAIDHNLLKEVAAKVAFIEQQEAQLKKILADHKVEPLLVVYEDILEDAPTQINRILDFLNITKPEGYVMEINSGIKRMPSNITQEIIRQYQEGKNAVN